MRSAGVESRTELDATLVVQAVGKREAALQSGPLVLKGRSVNGRHVTVVFARLENADLSTEGGVAVQINALLDARLRLPQPEISGAAQRRNAHLGERVRLAWSNQRLVLAEHDAGGFPVDPKRRGADAEQAVIRLSRPSEEIHIQRAADSSSADHFGTAKLDAQNGLAQRGAAGKRAALERSEDRRFHAAGLPGVHERVEQRHAG